MAATDALRLPECRVIMERGAAQWRIARRAVPALALLALVSAPATGQVLPDAQVSEYDPPEVRSELRRFDAVGDGLALTLAACDQEPHCVDAISQHEIARLIDRIQQRIEHLVNQGREEELTGPYEEFLARYRGLRVRYVEYLRQVWQVVQRVDADELDQDWEELLDFEIAEPEAVEPGRDVPEPNGQLTLKRFEDEHEPMPIE